LLEVADAYELVLAQSPDYEQECFGVSGDVLGGIFLISSLVCVFSLHDRGISHIGVFLVVEVARYLGSE